MDIFRFFGIIPNYKLLKITAAAAQDKTAAMTVCSEGKLQGGGISLMGSATRQKDMASAPSLKKPKRVGLNTP